MLNAKQCDAFYAVAKTGSFDLAAEQLNITASAVTLRVQSLEKQLEVLRARCGDSHIVRDCGILSELVAASHKTGAKSD